MSIVKDNMHYEGFLDHWVQFKNYSLPERRINLDHRGPSDFFPAGT
jgi:hypothetical protein